MSRVAKKPVNVPKGVDVKLNDQVMVIKGPKGELEFTLHNLVGVEINEGVISVNQKEESKPAGALAGTTRAIVQNMVTGVSEGFTKKLELVGVGYRAQAQGKKLNLTLGFSHPVVYELPDGVTAETPSQTEILVSGFDKQRVGQAAAEIRAFRPPEPYKGKGVKYADEHIVRKDAKKK